MQKIATRVFVYSSISFGLLGVIMVLTDSDPGSHSNNFQLVIGKLFMVTVFIILPSFALSVASKYLNGKS